MGRIRVLVADDHPAFREGFCQLLATVDDIEVIAKAGDGEEAVTLATTLQPDVAIIDASMPKLDGIESTRRIKTACPAMAIIIISTYDYESYLLASIRAGAAGYLIKTLPVGDLISAVRSVYSGETVFKSGAINGILARAASDSDRGKGTAALHGRELEVLKTAAKGMSNKQISAQLGISERTVQNHLSHIFQKLDVDSRFEAVSHALRQGWLMPDDLR